jgi:hypothetical protein
MMMMMMMMMMTKEHIIFVKVRIVELSKITKFPGYIIISQVTKKLTDQNTRKAT